VHLAGLLAEGQAIGELTAASDSALAASYGRLRGLAFPDSLVPITGRHRRALAADLLRVDNPAVQQWIDYFTGPGRRQFDHWLSRKASTDSLVTALLDRAGLPRELLYLAMIESGLSCYARSGVGAVGPWQFMPGTAKRYGLRCDWWVDERRDLELSTRAAVAYLSTLYEQFQDWALVLAAYNAGEARIARAIQRAGHDNFWRLHLPQQTAAHIPKFIAAARIGEAPARFGFAEAAKEPLAYDVVEVSDATDLGVIAKCAGVPDDELPALNPALLRRTSPPDSPRYPVRVPFGCGDRCERELRRIPPERRLTWRQHRVASGQTLSHIASQYGTSVTSLREANHLKNVNMIRPGDQLLIPMPAVLADKARQREEEKGHYVPPDGYERVSYRVKAGDTLGAIARRLGVSLKHLRKVNGLSSSLIRPGQKLYAYRPPRLSSASEAADREGG
jgi:membrane-bound lytic murein transglycosylase D